MIQTIAKRRYEQQPGSAPPGRPALSSKSSTRRIQIQITHEMWLEDQQLADELGCSLAELYRIYRRNYHAK